jgi:hypothetical protein
MSIFFTYLIGWKKYDRWYYGVRYSKKCNPNDLWNTYFTSSKHVRQFRKEFGEPDVIEVRHTFTSKESAVLWEERVLKKMNARSNEKWLNKNDASAPPVMTGEDHPLYGVGHTEEAKRKVSISNKGKTKGIPKSEEHKRKISEARKRNWATNSELKKRMSEMNKGNTYGKAHKGWNPSEETRKRMSKSAKTKTLVQCSCRMCGKLLTTNNLQPHWRANHA